MERVEGERDDMRKGVHRERGKREMKRRERETEGEKEEGRGGKE